MSHLVMKVASDRSTADEHSKALVCNSDSECNLSGSLRRHIVCTREA